MATIYKYPINSTDQQDILLPEGAGILTAQVQQGQVCLWARVDPSAVLTQRKIRVAGTGHPVGSGWAYLGTVQLMGGGLVLHIFEELAI